MTTLKSIRLFFQEGSSDKVYHAMIVEDGGAYSVEVEWGRRNAQLNRGKKAIRVPLAKAEQEYAKLVREKTKKGYQEIAGEVGPAAVSPPEGMGSGSRVAGEQRAKMKQAAQLLNAIEEAEAERMLADPRMIAQQKLDGVRIIAHVQEEIVATNRNGQLTSLSIEIARALSAAPLGTVLDGEVVPGERGPEYWLFDLLQHAEADLRGAGYVERYAALAELAGALPHPVKLVNTAAEENEKRALFEALVAQGAEGIVFKRADAPYKAGRPASGGQQLKYKFIKSADVFLTGNVGNAYQMAVYDGGREREVGKVFAGTTNDSRREIDQRLANGERPVAEVRYLYATDGDILYQPVFAQLRDDKREEECLLDQLLRTNRTVIAGAPSKAVPKKELARATKRPWIPVLKKR